MKQIKNVASAIGIVWIGSTLMSETSYSMNRSTRLNSASLGESTSSQASFDSSGSHTSSTPSKKRKRSNEEPAKASPAVEGKTIQDEKPAKQARTDSQRSAGSSAGTTSSGKDSNSSNSNSNNSNSGSNTSGDSKSSSSSSSSSRSSGSSQVASTPSESSGTGELRLTQPMEDEEPTGSEDNNALDFSGYWKDRFEEQAADFKKQTGKVANQKSVNEDFFREIDSTTGRQKNGESGLSTSVMGLQVGFAESVGNPKEKRYLRQEDALIRRGSSVNSFGQPATTEGKNLFGVIAVLDGHGNQRMPYSKEDLSQEAARVAPTIIQEHTAGLTDPAKIIQAIKNAFVHPMDAASPNRPPKHTNPRTIHSHLFEYCVAKGNCPGGGSTFVGVVFVNGKPYIVNLGDSRAVIVRTKDEQVRVTRLTANHKPDDPKEKTVIENRGGKIIWDDVGKLHRVGGPGVKYPLATSRALGNFGNFLIRTPDVVPFPFELEEGDIVALFCDGIHEKNLKDQDIAKIIVFAQHYMNPFEATEGSEAGESSLGESSPSSTSLAAGATAGSTAGSTSAAAEALIESAEESPEPDSKTEKVATSDLSFLQAAAEAIAIQALNTGSRDNISIQIFQVRKDH